MASEQPLDNLPLPKDTYIAFDAVSLRQLIIERMNKQGIFTDQNQIGSNLASIIDIVAYAYNTLIYYLNKTATESMFSEAQIYENVSRIVRLLDYKPLGFQSSLLPFVLEADEYLEADRTYIIPRYSTIGQSQITYSVTEDILFNKTVEGIQILLDHSSSKFLVQGRFVESSLFTPSGNNNEILYLITPENSLIDHNNIHVYVKHGDSNKWFKYEQSANLYLESGPTLKHELRFTENKQYELKFGDNLSGRKLETVDRVCVYYLVSDGINGQVGTYTFDRSRMARYNTPVFNKILEDQQDTYNISNLLNDTNINHCMVTNSTRSTLSQVPQTVDQIKESAVVGYRAQYRLVTAQDYAGYVKSNFSNFIQDAIAINNNEYMETYIKYFYDLGLENPLFVGRALYNQVTFGSSCNFNSIYLIVVPRSTSYVEVYVTPTQKQLISSTLEDTKMATTEIMFIDPIYMAVAIGVSNIFIDLQEPRAFDPSIEDLTVLQVVRNKFAKRTDESIKADVRKIFTDYFNQLNCSLGQTIDARYIESQISGIDGVESLRTTRTDRAEVSYNGLSLVVWNPNYFTSIDNGYVTGSKTLHKFQFPYLYDINKLIAKIVVI